MTTHKRCRNCKQNKCITEFSTFISNVNNQKYCRHTCKQCAYLKTKNKLTPADKRRHAQREKKRRDNPAYRMYHGAKQRAKVKKLAFDLDIEYIKSIIPEKCPILQLPFKNGNKLFVKESMSLDRIIPEKGYVKGNVAVISDRANRIKRDSSLEELEKIVIYLKNKL